MDVKVTKSLLMTVLITGSVMWGGATAFAEENVGEFSLDTMVVTAQRYEKKDVDIAASTEIFDQSKLEATGATNLYEALQYVAGMEIQQYGPSGSSMGNMTSKIIIRGNGNGTLVLVNGVPINIRGTYDLNDFPIENIERVEIIRGGGAVMYGSDATGGVINIITKKTRANYIKAGIGNRGQQQYSGSFQAGNFGFGYKYSKWGTINNVTNDGKNWEGPENNNFDLSYKFNDRLSLSASHNESNYDYIATQGKISKMGDTPANDANQKIKRNDIQLTYNDENGWKTTAYYIDRQREKSSNLLDGRFYSWEDEKSYNYGLDAQKLWHINDDTFLFGATYQSENYELDSRDQKYSNNKPKGDVVIESTGSQSRNNYSVYAQYDKKLSDKNSVILAARETWTNGAPNDVNFSNFSGQAQFIHKLNDNESLYASVGQSFKMPALYQIYKTDKNGNSADNLKSQKGMHYEMGWKKTIDDNRNLKVALFHYKIDDNITATLSSKTNEFTYKNENIRNTGIEAEYTYAVPKGFGYSVNASYGNPQVESVDASGVSSGWKQDFSRFDFKASITYRMDKWRSALSSSYVAGRHVEDEDFKPYLMMNLNADYAADSNNSFFVSLNNILDRKDISYKSSSSEYYVTPFTFMVGYKYSF